MSNKLRGVMSLLFCLFILLSILPAAFAEDSGDAADTSLPASVVRFLCDDDEALQGLTVYDAEGSLCAPSEKASDGTPDYGSYRLAPGKYRYFFHDEAGTYADLEDSFRVYGEMGTQLVPLSLSRLDNIVICSYTYINPIYVDVVSEEDIPEATVSAEEIREEMRQLTNGRRTGFLRDSANEYTTFEAAADDLRAQIHDFEAEITIHMLLPDAPTDTLWRKYAGQLYSAALEHTGISTEGDYIHYEYGGYNATGGYVGVASSPGLYQYWFVYSPLYYANKEQEAELTPVVNSILAELALDGKSDYEKICAIYDYLCEHVNYDHSTDKTNMLKYTAYAALIKNLAVCQGYSTAFYRLCLESGIDARVVTSTSINHAWNIVQFGGQYYELDATWDRWESTGGDYRHFLEGSASWNASGHATIGDEFSNSSFKSSYPLPVYDFSDVQALVKYGSASLNGHIIGLEDMIASIANSRGRTGLYLDQIRAVIEQKALESDSADTMVFEVMPVLNSYYQNACILKTQIGNEQLDDDYMISVRVSVPAAWGGKAVSYTLSSSGYEDVSKSVYVTENTTASGEGTGTYGFTLMNIKHFGTVTARLITRTVSFNSNGGSAVASQTVYYGEKAVMPDSPVKNGYWFGGWYTDSACTTRFDFENTAITDNRTLYAKWLVPDLVLPAALSTIDEDAFSGGAFTFVLLPEQATAIGKNAFADCPNLAYIYIPENAQIDTDAFGSRTSLTVLGKAGGKAAGFAKDHSFDFIPVS